MSNLNKKRLNLWMPILFSIVLIVGMVFGFQLNQSASFKKGITSIIQNDRLEEIISLINNRYVDYVDEEQLYRDGINGILANLDPHTYYIPLENVATTNDNLKGNYKGLGLEYFVYNDTLVVVSVIDNGPAANSNIQLGDKIIRINDRLVSGSDFSIEEVKSNLKNTIGDTVELYILSENNTKTKQVKLLREYIHQSSIDLAYKLTEEIGYIRINKFNEYTHNEFVTALETLSPHQLSGLILDLRQNGGGYMDAALEILDEFFDGNEVLLKISGSNFNNETYTANPGGKFTKGNVVVLIDETTASSAEIIAGAIQDWDRGVVIGRTSFGKGLVQEQFDLSDGSALRLTIAKYYTPTGRCIQRDYSIGKQAYEAESELRFKGLQNWEVIHDDADSIYSSLLYKRPLYSDVGIEPDVVVRHPEFMLSTDLWTVINGIDNFTNLYLAQHVSIFKGFKTIEQFQEQFEVTNSMMQLFKGSLNSAFVSQINNVWRNPQQLNYLKLMIKSKFARLLFRNQGYYKVLNSDNEVILKAKEVLQSPKTYNAILRQHQ